LANRARLETLYGPDGADLMEAVPGTGIAMGDAPVHVHFRGNKTVTDETLRIVGRLHQLEEVVANETSVTDAGMVHLSHLSKLRLLHLGGTCVSDAGLTHLQTLPLELVDLCRTSLSDDGLERLAAMKHLKELWIIGCHCTKEGIARFRANLPGCKVVADKNSAGN